MGSPLGPILADIFMSSLERKASRTLNGAVLYKRYVDDAFIITKSYNETQQVFNQLNRLHKDIQFTMETEADNRLPFLDIAVIRRPDGSISRSIHRKSTWSGQYLHFWSFAPIQYKRGLVRTLFDRAWRLCTSENLTDELINLKRTLELNGYPSKFVEKYSEQTKTNLSVMTVPKCEVSIQLPFKGDDVGQLLRRRLQAAVSRTFFAANSVVQFTTTQIPKPLVKTQLDLSAKSHVIYEFQCGCGATYVGRTERQLRTRAAEHIPAWVQRELQGSGTTQTTNSVSQTHRPPASSIARHLLQTGHQVDRGGSFRIIYTTPNPRLLKFAEAIAIKRRKPLLCQQKEVYISLALSCEPRKRSD